MRELLNKELVPYGAVSCNFLPIISRREMMTEVHMNDLKYAACGAFNNDVDSTTRRIHETLRHKNNHASDI